MKDRRTIVSFLITIFLILSACAKKEVLQPIPSQAAPEKVTTELLLNRIDFSNIAALSATIRLGIQKKGESKGVFPGILVYSHPDRLDVRIFGPLGLTVMETLFNEGILQVLIPPKDTLYTGTIPFNRLLPDHDSLVNSIKLLEETDNAYILYIAGAVQTDISSQHTKGLENELVIPPRPPLEKGGEGGFDSDLTIKAKYFFDKTTLSWKAIELYADGKKQVRIEIYRTEGAIPSDIGIHVRDAFFHLELKDIIFNKTLKDEYFKPLEASQSLPLSRFLRNLEPSQ